MLLTDFKAIKVLLPSRDVPLCVTQHVLAGARAPLRSPTPSCHLKFFPREGTCHGRGVPRGKALRDDTGGSCTELSQRSSAGFRCMSESGLVVSYSIGWKRHSKMRSKPTASFESSLAASIAT